MATELWNIFKNLTLLIEFSSYFTRIYMYKYHLLLFFSSFFWRGGCLTGKVLPRNYYDFIVLCKSLMNLRSSSVKVTILKQQGMAEDIKQRGVFSTS